MKANSDNISKAKTFATAAHAAVGQKRKYTGEDYIVHPERVAGLVEAYGGSDNMIAAAWLHDVVEDTQVTMEQIRKEFNSEIADLVEWLTDVSVASDGNRKARKAIDRQHTADAGRFDRQQNPHKNIVTRHLNHFPVKLQYRGRRVDTTDQECLIQRNMTAQFHSPHGVVFQSRVAGSAGKFVQTDHAQNCIDVPTL